MSNDRKLAEALAHIQQAEKCMKTSLFKWSPDPDGAVAEYIKAGTCYRNAKALSEAREAYIKAAELQLQMKSYFQAAKAYEQAGMLSKDNGETDKAVHYMERASFMFQEHGTPDTAALCLERAAKMVEKGHPAGAADLYKRASQIAELDDKVRQSAENIGKAGRLLLRLQRYEEGLSCLRKEIEMHASAENYAMIAKVVLGVVLTNLTQGDFVAADQFYRSSISYPEFGDSEEAMTIEQLLQTYDDGDEENARRVLALPLIKYMDNVFAKMARDMVIPGGMRQRRNQEVTGVGGTNMEDGAEMGLGGVAPTQLDDDELEGGLL